MYTGKQIKELRERRGQTRKEFAAELGVSPYTVKSWEYGQRHPSGPAVRLLEQLQGGKHA